MGEVFLQENKCNQCKSGETQHDSKYCSFWCKIKDYDTPYLKWVPLILLTGLVSLLIVTRQILLLIQLFLSLLIVSIIAGMTIDIFTSMFDDTKKSMNRPPYQPEQHKYHNDEENVQVIQTYLYINKATNPIDDPQKAEDKENDTYYPDK